MWTKMIDSLSGVAQPDPPRAARKVKQLVDPSAREAQSEEYRRRRLSTKEKEDLVLSALRVKGRLMSSELADIGVPGIGVGSVEMALRRLRSRGKVRLVMARPYWEVVE